MNQKEATIVAESVAKQLAANDERISTLIDEKIKAVVAALMPKIIEATAKRGLTAPNSDKFLDAIVIGSKDMVRRSLEPVVARLDAIERRTNGGHR